MDTARWLSQQLNQRDLKQADVARALGVTCKSVSNWARGIYDPTPKNLGRLKKFLSGYKAKRVEIVYPPFCAGTACFRCKHIQRCKKRDRTGYPVMCEGMTLKELKSAEAHGRLDALVWWQPCNSISDLDLE